MPSLKEAEPLPQESPTPPPEPRAWFWPSLFAALNVALLVFFSGLYFGFVCRWLAERGEWAIPVCTGLLFILSFIMLVWMNVSNPGILHKGSVEQGPKTVYIASVKNRAFRLQWCPTCGFHRPPRTLHCPLCNICVEDVDHHCRWVNNCVGQRNIRLFLLLILCLCIYMATILLSCIIVLVRMKQLPFTLDKTMATLVAVLSAGCLLPLLLLLLVQVMLVSTSRRSWETKCRSLPGHNPFDLGCVRNWHITVCAPLGPKYMSKVVALQTVVGHDWVPMPSVPSPKCHLEQHLPGFPPPGSVPLGVSTPGTGFPQSGEAEDVQKVRISPGLLPNDTRGDAAGCSHLRSKSCPEVHVTIPS